MPTSIRDRERDRTRSPFVRAATRVLPLAAAVACLGTAAAPAHAAEPWGFEQVTPVDKSGAEPVVNKPAIASFDGSAVKYSTVAAMGSQAPDGAPFMPSFTVRRGANGWSGGAIDAPIAPESPSGAIWSTVGAVSPDQTRAVVYSRRALAPGAVEGGYNIYRRDLLTGEYAFIGESSVDPLAYEYAVNFMGDFTGMVWGGSDDFDRIVLFLIQPLTEGLGEHNWGRSYVYQWDEGSGLTLLSRLADEGGAPMGAAVGLNSHFNGPRTASRVSADGRQVVLQTPRNDPMTWMPNPEAGLFVRRDGEVTVPISYSRLPGDDRTVRPVEDDSVVASPAGRFIVFLAADEHRLSADAPAESGRGFYLYDRDQPEDEQLRFIAPLSVSRQAAPVQLSTDGGTFYFKSQDVLAPGAMEWRDNLYVWRDGEVKLVAEGGGWGPGGTGELQYFLSGYEASPNGRYFAFSTIAQLTGEDTTYPGGCTWAPGVDRPAGWCSEAYLYDAETDTIACASCETDGQHRSRGHAGMGSGFQEATMGQARPLVTDDGEVFFDTPNALVDGDANGDRDVYAYRGGEHRLVSRATPGASAKFLTLSGDRKSVFIVTNDRIAGQDRDRLDDVYVTRAGAGLASQNPPAPRPVCEGASCREPAAERDAAPVAGTVSFNGSGNVKASRPVGVSVSRLKAAAGSAATLMVRVSSAGRISVSGPSVRRAGKSVGKGGRYRVKVALTAKAKRTLAQRKRLRLNVRVAFRAADGRPVTRRLTLTFKAPVSKKPASRKGGR
jgi:hypothetical protein